MITALSPVRAYATRNDTYDTDTGLYICSMATNQPFQMAHIASLSIWMVPGTWVEGDEAEALPAGRQLLASL